MTQITIRNIDDSVRLKLRIRAASKGRSLEAELRDILTRAAAEAQPPLRIGRSIRQRFVTLGGFDIELPPRGHARALPDFE
jgi:antitoxin FitA